MKNTFALIGFALTATALAWSTPLAGQDAAALERARTGLSPAAAAALEASVQAAARDGLPTQPLIDKALEGEAKGVPGERIVAVVRALHEELGRARGLLREGGRASPPGAEISAIAEALRRGVPEDALRNLARDDHSGPLGMESHVLADLLDRGVPVNGALAVLSAWRGRGADQAQLRELPAAVERRMRGGKAAADAAAAVASDVRRGRGLMLHGPPHGGPHGPGGSGGPGGADDPGGPGPGPGGPG